MCLPLYSGGGGGRGVASGARCGFPATRFRENRFVNMCVGLFVVAVLGRFVREAGAA